MIQAIVFLPLIGAILAGLISIFGAHARNPSGDTVEHHDDAHGHGAVPVNEDASVIHATGHETGMPPAIMATTITRSNRRRRARARPS
jgi:NADH-quinone oxidoreductase subunit L